MHERFTDVEKLNSELNDPLVLAAYKAKSDDYIPGILARILGGILVSSGNIVYGIRPSYLKFRAVEVIARVPYHSWASGAYTLLTLVYTNERRAMKLSKFSWFSEYSQDNETMHVVVISKLAKAEGVHSFVRGSLVPVLFAFIYFWVAYLLYLVHHKTALELNYVFESHAFQQYDEFLKAHEQELREKHMESEYLRWYGRHPKNQYEFFQSVRNDELIHRNNSLEEISAS